MWWCDWEAGRGAEFEDGKDLWVAMGFPDLTNSKRKKTAVGGTDTDAGSEVASLADSGAAWISVVAKILVIEG